MTVVNHYSTSTLVYAEEKGEECNLSQFWDFTVGILLSFNLIVTAYPVEILWLCLG